MRRTIGRRDFLVRTGALVGAAASGSLLTSCLGPGSQGSAGGPSASPSLRKIMDAPQWRGGRWGLFVMDLGTGKVLQRQAPTTEFLTGSTAKTFTVAAALGTLGVRYRFHTPVVASTRPDRSGELAGDLILVGRGDLCLGGRTKPDGTLDVPDFDHYDADAVPGLATLTPEDPLAGLDQLARQVVASGVRRARGEVIVDNRLWEPVQIGGIPITPLVVNDNLIDLMLTPGLPGAPAGIDWRPKTAAFSVASEVVTSAAGSTPQLMVSSPATGQIRVEGSLPVDARAPFIQTFQVPDPAAFARTLVIEALQRAGVAVDAAVVAANPSGRLPSPAAVAGLPQLAEYVSPPYSEYAKLINKVSHNLGANLIPGVLAAHRGQRTYQAGMQLIRRYARDAGLDPHQVTLVDGQGLAGDRVSPQAQVGFLRYLTGRPYFDEFFASTPILGVDGSLQGVVPNDDPARGHVHAKTGTLLGPGAGDSLRLQTKALAGYIDAPRGGRLAFAIYLNDVPITPRNAVQTALDANRALGAMASSIYTSQQER